MESFMKETIDMKKGTVSVNTTGLMADATMDNGNMESNKFIF